MFIRCTDAAQGQHFDLVLRKPIITVGRAPGNDIVLNDPDVAPTHANILKKTGHVTISVLSRDKLISIGGRRARSADLAPGDSACIGRFELTVHKGACRPGLMHGSGRALIVSLGELCRSVDGSAAAARVYRDRAAIRLVGSVVIGCRRWRPRLPKEAGRRR